MSVPAHDLQLSQEEYFEMEASSIVRHEYVRGRVFAMTGATDAHNIIVGNLFLLVGSKLKGSACRAYVNDMKVRVQTTDSFYYPDIMVTCEQYSAKSVFKDSPFLIVEVLSPSTADIDRREKLAAYQTIESLNQYTILYQDKRRVELYSRNKKGWTASVFEDRDNFPLQIAPDLELKLTLDEIYDGVI